MAIHLGVLFGRMSGCGLGSDYDCFFFQGCLYQYDDLTILYIFGARIKNRKRKYCACSYIKYIKSLQDRWKVYNLIHTWMHRRIPVSRSYMPNLGTN